MVVLWGWAIVGMIIEAYGFILLFGLVFFNYVVSMLYYALYIFNAVLYLKNKNGFLLLCQKYLISIVMSKIFDFNCNFNFSNLASIAVALHLSTNGYGHCIIR